MFCLQFRCNFSNHSKYRSDSHYLRRLYRFASLQN